jgi:hypothetical protein
LFFSLYMDKSFFFASSHSEFSAMGVLLGLCQK